MNKKELKQDLKQICSLVREIESIAQKYMDPHPLKERIRISKFEEILKKQINTLV